MTSRLRIVLIIILIIYFIIILGLLKRKALMLRYSLLWLLAGIIVGVLIIWPTLMISFATTLGIYNGMNGLIFACIGCIMVLLMSLTSIISKQAEKIKNLTQTIARIEKRLREVEEQDGDE